MKKLLLISALALSIFACTSDEVKDRSDDCDCGRITQIWHLTLDDGRLVTTLKVRNNCSGLYSTIGISGHHYSSGELYCN